MTETFIGNQIKRCNRNFIWTNMIGLLLIVGFCSLFTRAIYNEFKGPFPVKADELAAIQDPSSSYKFHVSFVPERTSTTIASEQEYLTAYAGMMESSATSKYEFMLAQVGTRLLIVRTLPNATLSDELSGELYKVPLNVYQIASQVLGKSNQQLLLPYMLDTTGLLHDNIVMLLWFTIPLGVLAFINLVRAIYRIVNPHEHPLYKRMRKFGVTEEIEADINSDYAAEHIVEKDFIITSKWIIRKNTYSLKIAKNYFDHGTYDLHSVFR